MPDYARLKAEIAKPAYAGLTDDQIVAAINAPTAGPAAPASIAAILNYLRQSNLWLPIKAAASGSSPNPGAEAAVDIFTDTHTQAIDLTVPAAQGLLAGLVSANLLTSAQSAALVALCNTTTSIAASYGAPQGVTIGDIQTARIQP